jgi:hypothetical protein
MRMVNRKHPNWGLVYLGGSFSAQKETLRMGRIGASIIKAKQIYQTHAFVIQRTIIPDVLSRLSLGFAADAALVSWSRAPSSQCFLFHPQQLMEQPGGSHRWKDSDIFVQGEFFKKDTMERTGEEYAFDPASIKPVRGAHWHKKIPRPLSSQPEFTEAVPQRGMPDKSTSSSRTIPIEEKTIVGASSDELSRKNEVAIGDSIEHGCRGDCDEEILTKGSIATLNLDEHDSGADFLADAYHTTASDIDSPVDMMD